MIRRPPRSTLDRSSAASDVYKRQQHKSTVVTTNRAFADWGEVFPNAACVVSLIDRLMHRAEVVRIDGASYRAKEAEELSLIHIRHCRRAI